MKILVDLEFGSHSHPFGDGSYLQVESDVSVPEELGEGFYSAYALVLCCFMIWGWLTAVDGGRVHDKRTKTVSQIRSLELIRKTELAFVFEYILQIYVHFCDSLSDVGSTEDFSILFNCPLPRELVDYLLTSVFLKFRKVSY